MSMNVNVYRLIIEYNVYEHECNYVWGQNVILEAEYIRGYDVKVIKFSQKNAIEKVASKGDSVKVLLNLDVTLIEIVVIILLVALILLLGPIMLLIA